MFHRIGVGLARAWHAVARWFAGPWSLRRRLLAGFLGLLLVLGAVIGGVSSVFLYRSLQDRLDDQLMASSDRSGAVLGGNPYGGNPWSPPAVTVFVRGEGAGAIGMIVVDNVVVRAGYIDENGAVQPLSADNQRRIAAIAADGAPHTVDLSGMGDYRVVVKSIDPDHDAYVVVGLSLSDVEATVGQLLLIAALVTVAALVIAVVAGFFVVRLALRPLDRVVATATRVSQLQLAQGAVDLTERVPEADSAPGTEVGRVGTALNRLLDRVQSALTARQESEDTLRRFVADASHELRTPLASIRGYSEFLRMSGARLSADGKRSVARIESESQRMSALVEDLLLLARLDSGPAIVRQPVDLSTILVDAVSDAHAAGPDHLWNLDLPEEPVTVEGDPQRLHQVVANLLTNARVHTPSGTAVTATLSSDAGRVRLSVADDGPGIPADLQPHLFERFVRGDDSRSRSNGSGSSGLGLAIVAAIVEAHGGTVTVSSEPGRTEFVVDLPAGVPS